MHVHVLCAAFSKAGHPSGSAFNLVKCVPEQVHVLHVHQGLFQGGQGVLLPPLGICLPPLGIGFSVLLIWGCPSLALYLPPP